MSLLLPLDHLVYAATDLDQAVAEFAFKYQGFSTQNEFHWKNIQDTTLAAGQAGNDNDLYGLYSQFGYFFNEIWSSVPEELELAARYAYVNEPNKSVRSIYNEREEFTLGANWFFAGHSNKITVDFSHLNLEDGRLMSNHSENRFRIQWDVSF